MRRWPSLVTAVLATCFAPGPALANVGAPPIFWDDPEFAEHLGYTIVEYVVLTAALILCGVWFKRSKAGSWGRFSAVLFTGAVLCLILVWQVGSGPNHINFSNRPPDLPRGAYFAWPPETLVDDERSGAPLAPTEPELSY